MVYFSVYELIRIGLQVRPFRFCVSWLCRCAFSGCLLIDHKYLSPNENLLMVVSKSLPIGIINLIFSELNLPFLPALSETKTLLFHVIHLAALCRDLLINLQDSSFLCFHIQWIIHSHMSYTQPHVILIVICNGQRTF